MDQFRPIAYLFTIFLLLSVLDVPVLEAQRELADKADIYVVLEQQGQLNEKLLNYFSFSGTTQIDAQALQRQVKLLTQHATVSAEEAQRIRRDLYIARSEPRRLAREAREQARRVMEQQRIQLEAQKERIRSLKENTERLLDQREDFLRNSRMDALSRVISKSI